MPGTWRTRTRPALPSRRVRPQVTLEGVWGMWIQGAGVEGIDATRGTRFNMTSDVISAAIGGAGVALGRSSMVDDDLDAGRLVKPFDLAVPVEFAFYVVYRKGSLEQQKVADFREWLFAEAAS